MDLKITCGSLYTGDRAGRFFSPAALVTRGERIAWVGRAEECPVADSDPGYDHMDAGSQVLIPGLINAHGHSSLNAWRGCSDAQDFATWAARLSPYTSRLTQADVAHSNTYSVAEMLRCGTTCVCDCTRYGAGQLAEAAARFGMRCVAGGLANSPEYRRDGRPNFDAIVADTARYSQTFAGHPLVRFHIGAHSPYNCTGELIRQAFGAAEAMDCPFVIHGAETADETRTIQERHGMRPIPWLDSLGALSPRTVLVHGVYLDEADIRIIQERGCGVVHCPVSNAKLGNGAAPVAELLAAGIPVGLGTDSMLSNNSLDLFGEMKAAALVHRLRGIPSQLSCASIVSMATLDGARVLGLDHTTGSLEAGKLADMVLLDCASPLGYNRARLLSDLVFYVGPRHVRAVWVGGACVYADGAFPSPEAEADLERTNRYFSLQYQG